MKSLPVVLEYLVETGHVKLDTVLCGWDQD